MAMQLLHLQQVVRAIVKLALATHKRCWVELLLSAANDIGLHSTLTVLCS
jgi:hypothetical protein